MAGALASKHTRRAVCMGAVWRAGSCLMLCWPQKCTQDRANMPSKPQGCLVALHTAGTGLCHDEGLHCILTSS